MEPKFLFGVITATPDCWRPSAACWVIDAEVELGVVFPRLGRGDAAAAPQAFLFVLFPMAWLCVFSGLHLQHWPTNTILANDDIVM